MELDYKSQKGQTVFDVSNITLYGMDNIVLGLLKPSNISLTSDLNTDDLIYDDSYIEDKTIQLELNVTAQNPIYYVTGKENQSIFDLCIMNYGNLDKLTEMLKDNSNLVSINDIDVSLKQVIFNEKKLVDAYVVFNINKKRYSFATIEKSSYLLLEDGYYLLQENGFKILL